MLRCIATGVTIRTTINEDLDTLPVYDITSPMFWDTTGDTNKRQQLIDSRGEQRKGETRRVNLLAMWEESTNNLLIPTLSLFVSFS